MRLQEHLVRSTQRALDDVCRAALAVPADRRDWSPGGEARSVLDQMREVALTGTWFLPILAGGTVPSGVDHQAVAQEWGTVEECVEAARERIGALCRAMADFPDEGLEHEVHLPFGGGTVLPMSDVLALAGWNLVYHLGQINQIQLILGDREMH